jgi:outer membrane receptor for ferrienterochelin and colicin
MNTRIIALLSFFLTIGTSIDAQIINFSGRILNDKNEPIPAASVQLADGTGTSSDLEGRFILKMNAGSTYELTISAVGYNKKTISEVDVKPGQLNEKIFILSSSSKNMSGVVVESKSSSKKETVNALISYQKNTNTVASVISAEAIRRSPDRNTGEVLKRVPGTSIQEGKYLVVRGLADRYNQAMLNGVLLSSTEPDRKTFSFDLFPSTMIDNIIINKAFVPELPGEWAGGLVQVQTKEIPSNNFFNIQLGTGFNDNTIGNPFYQYTGGNLDWLGIENGNRALPNSIPTKSNFANLSQTEKNELGKKFRNVWSATSGNAPINSSLQANGGFTGKLFNKKIGGIFAITYNQNNRRLEFDNAVIANRDGSVDLSYNNNRYSRDVLAGVLGNLSIQLNSQNKISFKNILNVNTSDFVTDRFDGFDNAGIIARVKAQELGFRQNTFFNTQVIGDHNITDLGLKVKWYGGFNILDQYIPDQRRLFYTQDLDNPNAPWIALLGLGASQKSGSIFYSNLSDYIYNFGTDMSRTFEMFGEKQTLKFGYMHQSKDRLFNSRPFFMNTSSTAIKTLSPDQIFSSSNFGIGADKVQFEELTGDAYRYIANSQLHAAYLQFDNVFGKKWRFIWGVRMEDFNQIVGSKDKSDRRYVQSRVTDFLPGFNLTFKPTSKSNIRLSGSQTIVRPEFRELSPFAFYDFELNAQVVGNNQARRTKIFNADLRYEIYPRGGEMLTFGVFYKSFRDPLEYYFNQTGPATNTFNVANIDQAQAYGAEFEFRKNLDFITEKMKNFTMTGNVSYIYSKVKDTASINRPLQGQSPYLINLGLQYDIKKAGITTTLLFNQIGRRILFVGNEAIPNIWENPRPLLDFQVTKKLMKEKAEVRISISDIFNKRAFFYHDLDDSNNYNPNSKDKLAINRNYGTNFSITFNYTIK